MLYTATDRVGANGISPRNNIDLQNGLMPLAPTSIGPIAIRYPRGAGVGVPLAAEGFRTLPIGQGEMMRDGNDVAILAVGPIVYEALKAAEDLAVDGISVAVANARYVKPLDADLIIGLAARCKHIVTIEENSIHGGFGSAVAEFLANYQLAHPTSNVPHPYIIGLPDEFIEHGAPKSLMEDVGLTRESIRERIRAIVHSSATVPVA